MRKNDLFLMREKVTYTRSTVWCVTRRAPPASGTIGLGALARVVNHPALRGLPFYPETPNDLEGNAREIACAKGLAGEWQKQFDFFQKHLYKGVFI